MLSDSGPQPCSAHEETRTSSRKPPTPSEIKGTQTAVLPSQYGFTAALRWAAELLSCPYYHAHLKEHLAPADHYWFL